MLRGRDGVRVPPAAAFWPMKASSCCDSSSSAQVVDFDVAAERPGVHRGREPAGLADGVEDTVCLTARVMDAVAQEHDRLTGWPILDQARRDRARQIGLRSVGTHAGQCLRVDHPGRLGEDRRAYLELVGRETARSRAMAPAASKRVFPAPSRVCPYSRRRRPAG